MLAVMSTWPRGRKAFWGRGRVTEARMGKTGWGDGGQQDESGLGGGHRDTDLELGPKGEVTIEMIVTKHIFCMQRGQV